MKLKPLVSMFKKKCNKNVIPRSDKDGLAMGAEKPPDCDPITWLQACNRWCKMQEEGRRILERFAI